MMGFVAGVAVGWLVSTYRVQLGALWTSGVAKALVLLKRQP